MLLKEPPGTILSFYPESNYRTDHDLHFMGSLKKYPPGAVQEVTIGLSGFNRRMYQHEINADFIIFIRHRE